MTVGSGVLRCSGMYRNVPLVQHLSLHREAAAFAQCLCCKTAIVVDKHLHMYLVLRKSFFNILSELAPCYQWRVK